MIDLTPTPDELQALQAQEREQSLEEALRREYDELVRDKRDEAAIPCYEWYSDPEGGPAHCHCNCVPGNLWGAQVPHDESNYTGKPWCIPHQTAGCDEAHPFISFAAFVLRSQRAVGDGQDTEGAHDA